MDMIKQRFHRNAEPKAEAVEEETDSSLDAQIREMATRELELDRRRQELLAEMPTLRDRAGVEVLEALDGSQGSDVRDMLALKIAELEGLEAAIRGANVKRRDLLKQRQQRQADAKRQRAQQLREEADRRTQRTQALLSALEEFEQAPYIPRFRFEEAHMQYGAYVEAPSLKPKTERLRDEADELEAEATRKEKQRLKSGGQVEAETCDGLMEALLADPFKITPDLLMVREWAASAAEARATEVHREGFTPRDFRLRWRDGRVDYQYSRVDGS